MAPVLRLEELFHQRRSRGGTAGTGLVALLSYELFGNRKQGPDRKPALPDLHVWEVNESLTWEGGRQYRYSSLGEHNFDPEAVFGVLDKRSQDLPGPATGSFGRQAAPQTSMPRADYIEAVRRIQKHIRKGDIYQANLTQQFGIPFAGDRFQLWSRLAAATPAPRAAFVSSDRFAMVSVSPELFLRGEMDGMVETWPIKGTCRRENDPESDSLAAKRLVASPKDNAELLMIVDLERNDLGRVCRTGSVQVPRIAALKQFPAVYHLQAQIQGVLEGGTRFGELLKATFPGGSITGAPKESAVRILEQIEPVERRFYTGSLFWLGDDDSFDSSILIRSVVLADGMAYLGAGGGIVADSDPEAEWIESCDKARALAGVLGFAPEEAL